MAFDPLYAAGPGRPVNLSQVGRSLAQFNDPNPMAPDLGVPDGVAYGTALGAPKPEGPYQPTQRDRITGAVASFGANTDPNSVYAPEQFLGSAARGFAGVKNYLANLAGQHAASQRQAQEDDLRRRLAESQIGARQAYRGGNAPRVGASVWVVDPDDPTQEMSLTKDPVTGAMSQDTFPDGRPLTRPVRPTTGAAKEANTRYDNVAGLRREFNGLMTNHRTIAGMGRTLEAAAQNPSAAGDLSLIFAYMRILDPTSSVKENEYANAQNAAGVPERVRALFNNLRDGSRLAPAQRADFLDQARALLGAQRVAAQQQIDRYTAIATANGFNPTEVVDDPYAGLGARSTTPGRSNPSTPP